MKLLLITVISLGCFPRLFPLVVDRTQLTMVGQSRTPLVKLTIIRSSLVVFLVVPWLVSWLFLGWFLEPIRRSIIIILLKAEVFELVGELKVDLDQLAKPRVCIIDVPRLDNAKLNQLVKSSSGLLRRQANLSTC